MKRLTHGKDLNGDSGSSLRAPFFLSFFFNYIFKCTCIYPGHSFHCMRRFTCVSDVSGSLQQFSETTEKVWKFEAENHCFLVLRDSFVRIKIIDPWQIVLRNISGPIANFHSKSLISLSSSSGSLSLRPSLLSDICDPRDPWEPNRLIGVWVLFRSCLDADWVEWRSFWNAYSELK